MNQSLFGDQPNLVLPKGMALYPVVDPSVGKF